MSKGFLSIDERGRAWTSVFISIRNHYVCDTHDFLWKGLIWRLYCEDCY